MTMSLCVPFGLISNINKQSLATTEKAKNDESARQSHEACFFKGIQWTREFVTGPLDHVHNEHKFYCQICKTNVSIYSKGAHKIVRHYQSEAHLRKNHRSRYEHLGKFDKITGITVHAVRGKDGKFSPQSNWKTRSLFLN